MYRAPCGGGRGKDEPLSAIAMALQAAPGNDDLPPPGPPRHTSAAQCLTTRTHEASPCAGYPAHGGSLPATYPRKRGPRAWHTGVRQTAQRLGDRGRTSSRATQRHQPLARRTSLRPPVGTSARRGRTAQCGRQLALPAGVVGENRHGEGRPPPRGRPPEGSPPGGAPKGIITALSHVDRKAEHSPTNDLPTCMSGLSCEMNLSAGCRLVRSLWRRLFD